LYQFVFVLVLSIGILIKLVKNKRKAKKKCQKQILLLAKELLNTQIEILEKEDFKSVTMELEIAKYLRDAVIYRIADGSFDERDIRKAHKWIQDEFKENLDLCVFMYRNSVHKRY